MTGEAAVQGIRSIDESGSVGMISAEPDPPYKRPPLSKGLWKGQSLERIWYKTDERNADFHLGRTIQLVEPRHRWVVDDQGTQYTYDKLLLATGGSPRRLPFDDGNMNYFRTVEDYRRLRADTESYQRFVVIGGGFIGSELAAALAMNSNDVTMIFPGDAVCSHVLPRDLARFLNDYYEGKGVELVTEATVTGLERRGGRSVLKVVGEKGGGEREVEADRVVAGIGITPNTELAQQAGLDVGNGIIVDEFLRTSKADIFAAGDVASFVNPALGKRVRVEHEDNAKTMGRIAGQNMAGDLTPYDHLPFFYSDLFDLGYEAVGELDSRTETVSDWKEPYRKGVVYYLREGRVSGVLLWNVWNQVDAARRLIAEPGPFRPEDLRGRLAEDRG
jgi:NADPH-dependent 2,4-dienoyl-CoA reductase/sulfur reductase-like enzyme